jgi:hypothetical protein
MRDDDVGAVVRVGAESVPPIDPVTGQVMTKRAIRRRIVKNWERKQKELLGDCPQVRSTNIAARAEDGTVHQGAVPQRTSIGATRFDETSSMRAPSPTPVTTVAAHPLRNAAAVPVISDRFLDEHGAPLFRLGSCLPTIDQRPPFEFLFRMPNSTPARSVSGEKNTEREDHMDGAHRLRSDCAVVDDAFLAALALRDGSCGTDERADHRRHEGRQGGSRRASQAPSSKLPIPNSFAPFTNDNDDDDDEGRAGISSPTSPAGFLAFRPVIRRVERQASLPLAPFSPGTDLNPPPENYLSMDSVWGLHRHAPGFYRDAEAATHSLMSAATRIFSDEGRAVNVISTGEAMTRLFESSFRADQPFTVHVHRVGPAIVLHAPEHGMPQQTVDQVRKKALLSKALYRMSAGGPRQLTARAVPEGGVAAALPSDDRAVALRGTSMLHDADMPRAGSLAFSAAVQHNESLHNFGNVLHWGIQNLEVLIGLDTPVLLDRDHDNAEVAFAMHDALSGMEITEPGQVQYDALRCWFESTLANVAHVGFCVHNRGIVQSFELKKVTDLLTFAEAQVATAAMGFTTNALRWLTEHCTEDGTDYAVIRNPETNTLELYALHHATSAGAGLNHVEGMWSEDHETEGVDNSNDQPRSSRGTKGGSVPQSTMPAGGKQPQSPLDVTLAVLCYRMGIHLLEKGKPAEALKLLLRSFQIHHLHCHDEASAAPMLDICSRMPTVVKEYLAAELPRCAFMEDDATDRLPPHAEVPSRFQEVMFACMRIEDRVRQMLEHYTVPGRSGSSASGRVALSAPSLASMLLWCAAALGLIVDGCVGWWCDIHARLTQLKRLVVHRQRDSAVQLHTVIFKELVQVSLEGVVVLEGICLALRPGAKDATAMFPEGLPAVGNCTGGVGGVNAHHGESVHHGTANGGPTWKLDTSESVCCTALARTTSTSPEEVHLHQILPSRELVQLTTAICELLGDMCLCALADCSPTTVTTLREVSQLMLSSSARSSSSLAVFTNLQLHGGGGETAIFQETMQWYSKVQTFHSGRHLNIQRKIATAYFHFAVQFHQTDRWTKAVENLKRALDALVAPSPPTHALPSAPVDERGVKCVTTEQARLELCVVWLKMCRRRRDQQPSVRLPTGPSTPCCDVFWGLLHRTCPQFAAELLRPLPEDEKKQLQYCLSELRQCEVFYENVPPDCAGSDTSKAPTSSATSTPRLRAVRDELNAITTSILCVEVLFAVRLCHEIVHSVLQSLEPRNAQQRREMTSQVRVAEDLLLSASDHLGRLATPRAGLRMWLGYGWVSLMSVSAFSMIALSSVAASTPNPTPRDEQWSVSEEGLRRAMLIIVSQTLSCGAQQSTRTDQHEPQIVAASPSQRVLDTLSSTMTLATSVHENIAAFICATIVAENDAVKRQQPRLMHSLRTFQRDICQAAIDQPSEPTTSSQSLVRLCRIAIESVISTARSTPLPSTSTLSTCFNILTELLRGACIGLSRNGDDAAQLGRWKAVLGKVLLARSEGGTDVPQRPTPLDEVATWNQLRVFLEQCLSEN